MRVSIGIDLGTSATKVGLYDAQQGRLLGMSSQAYEISSPRPGWAELEAHVYWRAVVDGVKAVMAGSSEVEVAGIGLSSQGQTFVVLDEHGAPLRPAIVWLDVRAEQEAAEIGSTLGVEEYTRRTGLPRLSAIESLSKLVWLRRHEPEVMDRCARALVLPSYIALRLTGCAACDAANGASMGVLDRYTGRWWPEPLRLCGLTVAALGELRQARDAAGSLTSEAAAELGLAPGIPVAVGTNDQYSGALSVGNRAPGMLSGTLGTAMPLVTVVPEVTPLEGRGLLLAPHPLGTDWFAMAYTKTAAACLSWLRELLADGETIEELTQEASLVPPGAEGVVCLPHLAGMATPSFDSRVRGGFLGLGLNHERGHLARAVMESVCYSARDCLALLGTIGTQWDRAVLTGGATVSESWMGMLADVLDLTVVVTDAPEAACRGAALLGMLAAGDEAALGWPGESLQGNRVYHPNPGVREAYGEGYARYTQAMDAIHPGARRTRS